MKLFHNPLFFGRDHELKKLVQVLNETKQAIVITGIPGIGKTQLAVEFAWRYGRYFPDGVFWLNFEDSSHVLTEVAECGKENHLNLQNFDGVPLTEQVNRVLDEWGQEKSRLLIFDNCEDEELFEEWQIKAGKCRILVTSRIGDWDPHLKVQVLHLDALNIESSTDLLKALTKRDKDENLRLIAEQLDRLPLALYIAGRYLFDSQYTISSEQFLADLSDQSLLNHPFLSEFKAKRQPTGYERRISQVFTIIINKLDRLVKVDIAALNLLSQAACLAPGEPIPPVLLRVSRDGSYLLQQNHLIRSSSSNYDPHLTSKGIRRLVNLGLLDRRKNENSISLLLHLLLAEFVKKDVSQLEAQTAIESAMLDAINQLSRQKSLLNTLHFLHNHLRHVTEAAYQKVERNTLSLCSWLGYYLNELSDHVSALKYYERSLEIAKSLLGQQHLFCFRCLVRIGQIQQTIEQLNKAQESYHAALGIIENVFGSKHPRSISLLKRLAAVYREIGDLKNAYSYYERSLQITEEVFGAEHPNTISSLDEMAYLLDIMREKEASLSFYQRALDITRKKYGSNYPRLIIYFQNIGTLRREMKDAEGARAAFQEAFRIQEIIFGSNHVSTASSLSSIGVTFRVIRNYKEASNYFRRALHIREQALGEEHPDTIQNLNDYGYVRWLMGELNAAHLFYDRVFYLHDKNHGIEDTNTLQSLNSLVGLLRAKGDIEEANRIVKQKLKILKQRVGSGHPSTQRVQEMLR